MGRAAHPRPGAGTVGSCAGLATRVDDAELDGDAGAGPGQPQRHRLGAGAVSCGAPRPAHVRGVGPRPSCGSCAGRAPPRTVPRDPPAAVHRATRCPRRRSSRHIFVRAIDLVGVLTPNLIHDLNDLVVARVAHRGRPRLGRPVTARRDLPGVLRQHTTDRLDSAEAVLVGVDEGHERVVAGPVRPRRKQRLPSTSRSLGAAP